MAVFWSMTRADLMSSVAVTISSAAIDRIFINAERQALQTGRSRTRTDIDPVHSLHETHVSASPSSLPSIAKDPQGKMCVNWFRSAHAQYYLRRHWTSSKKPHPSLWTITVELKLSRFPLKGFYSFATVYGCSLIWAKTFLIFVSHKRGNALLLCL